MVKNYDSIDLMKFIACIFVVAIHSAPFQDISPLLNRVIILGIGRIAVPLFFLASAFFLFKSNEINIKKYLKRMGKLYFAWFLISSPITFFNHFIIEQEPLLIKCFTFVKCFFFTSTFSGSWFLASCVFCTCFFYLMEKYNILNKGFIITISFLIYIICVSTSAWGKLLFSLIPDFKTFFDNIVFWFAKPYISILVGLPYFSFGYYLAKNEEKVKKPHSLITLLLLIALLAEVYLTYIKEYSQSSDCYFLLLPCAYCIFVKFLKRDIHIQHASQLRNSSTLIFFSQFIWLFAIEFAEWILKIKIPQIGKFAIALTLCLITSVIVIKLSNKYKILKILY